MSDQMVCPRCSGTEFSEVDCGPDGYDDDITYTSDICKRCELWYDGWVYEWFVDVSNWRDVEGAERYTESVPKEHA